jgi:hypothetical protein
MEITPPINPLERNVPNDQGWVIHDFKYNKKKSVSNVKLETLFEHEERLMKIKKIQYGNKYSDRDLKLIVKQELKKRPSSVMNSQSWNEMTSPRSPKSMNKSWRVKKNFSKMGDTSMQDIEHLQKPSFRTPVPLYQKLEAKF